MNETGSGSGDDKHKDAAEYWEDEGVTAKTVSP